MGIRLFVCQVRGCYNAEEQPQNVERPKDWKCAEHRGELRSKLAQKLKSRSRRKKGRGGIKELY